MQTKVTDAWNGGRESNFLRKIYEEEKRKVLCFYGMNCAEHHMALCRESTLAWLLRQ
jgi:hypothetical protein